jgi:hypothetical protein
MMMSPTLPELIAAGESYAARGWSMLPLKSDKKPAVGWKLRQTEPVAPADLGPWFRRLRGVAGVGVVLGAVSGHLWVRDFDEVEGYRRWAAAHPAAAARHPTAQTGRGFHVYGRWPGAVTLKLADGELRAEGAYVVVPPSPHPGGTLYRWLVQLPDGDVPEADPASLGLCDDRSCNRENRANRETESTEWTERTEETQANRATEAMKGFAFGVCSQKIEAAIARTLPRQYASRNAHLFRLARALKAIPELAVVTPERMKELKPIVRTWHERALPNMLTKDFGETWGDFAHAWKRVRHPEGADVLGEAVAAARAAEPPAWSEGYSAPQRLLAALCRELQRRAGDAAFFLGVLKAGECVGVDKTTAWRWLIAFEADGALRTAVKGSQRSRKATRYQYLADDL